MSGSMGVPPMSLFSLNHRKNMGGTPMLRCYSMVIRLQNIRKHYTVGPEKIRALDGVDLSVDRNEYVAVMGTSGSGKSTLMNILGCLDSATDGTYELDGRNVTKMGAGALARVRNERIGFVFQSFNLLPRLTIFENVELPMIYAGIPSALRKERTKEALEKVGLLEWAKHKPNEISGGQKQRVSIARAICNDPSVIMADEPTGNLDTKSAIDIMRVFQALNDEGRTIIMITHEQENVPYFKRIISCRDGLIIEDKSVEKRTILKEAQHEDKIDETAADIKQIEDTERKE